MGKILVSLFFNRVWGETGLPEGLLATIQSIGVAGTPTFSNLALLPKQNHIFWASNHCSKPCPSRVQRPIRDPGPECGSKVPNVVARSRNIKVAYRKPMQEAVVNIAIGAICCKLWPKTHHATKAAKTVPNVRGQRACERKQEQVPYLESVCFWKHQC